MLDDGIEVLSVRLPLFETLFSIAFELFVLVLNVGLRLLGLCQLPQEFFLPLVLLFLHLTLQLVCVLLVQILPEAFVIRLFFLQSGQLFFPSLFEFLVVLYFMLFFASPPFDLVLERLFIL